jgi:hypothetical protein
LLLRWLWWLSLTNRLSSAVQVQQLLLLSSPPQAMTWGGGARQAQWELVVASACGGLQQLTGVKVGRGLPLRSEVPVDFEA